MTSITPHSTLNRAHVSIKNNFMAALVNEDPCKERDALKEKIKNSESEVGRLEKEYLRIKDDLWKRSTIPGSNVPDTADFAAWKAVYQQGVQEFKNLEELYRQMDNLPPCNGEKESDKAEQPQVVPVDQKVPQNSERRIVWNLPLPTPSMIPVPANAPIFMNENGEDPVDGTNPKPLPKDIGVPNRDAIPVDAEEGEKIRNDRPKGDNPIPQPKQEPRKTSGWDWDKRAYNRVPITPNGDIPIPVIPMAEGGASGVLPNPAVQPSYRNQYGDSSPCFGGRGSLVVPCAEQKKSRASIDGERFALLLATFALPFVAAAGAEAVGTIAIAEGLKWLTAAGIKLLPAATATGFVFTLNDQAAASGTAYTYRYPPQKDEQGEYIDSQLGKLRPSTTQTPYQVYDAQSKTLVALIANQTLTMPDGSRAIIETDASRFKNGIYLAQDGKPLTILSLSTDKSGRISKTSAEQKQAVAPAETEQK